MTKNSFLSFKGLATNMIDSQVLIHCKNMKKIGIDFETWMFACIDRLYKNLCKESDMLKNYQYAR